MKKSLFSCFSLALALVVAAIPTSLLAAGSFEGRLKMKMQPSKGDPQLISYAIKGQQMRMEIPTGKDTMVGLLDWNKREMCMLMPGQPMYMVIDLKDGLVAQKIEKAQENTALEKTSETATIVGRETTKYIARDGKNVTELWLASGIGTFYGMGGGGNPMKGRKLADWEKELVAKGMFPLKTVTYDAKGKQTMSMEAVELTPQKLDDSLFVPPANYTRFSMGNLLKGLGGN